MNKTEIKVMKEKITEAANNIKADLGEDLTLTCEKSVLLEIINAASGNFGWYKISKEGRRKCVSDLNLMDDFKTKVVNEIYEDTNMENRLAAI